MHTLELTLSAESDLAYVLETEAGATGSVGQWSAAQHLACMEDATRRHWVLRRAGIPLGYAIAYDLVERACGMYLKRLVVRERRRGMGRRAIEKIAECAAAEMHAPYLWLGVYPDNLHARRFYAACGFLPFDAPAAVIEAHKAASDGSGLDGCLLLRLTVEGIG